MTLFTQPKGISPDAKATQQGNAMTAENDFHIWVNRRRFGGAQRLGAISTGSDIAVLIGVPTDNARIDLETDAGALREIDINETITVENGMHFLVTRRYVMGGVPLTNDAANCSF